MTDSTASPEVQASALHARLEKGLAEMHADVVEAVDARARERLIAFLLVLQRWNRAFNLTAVRDPLEMIPRHLLDSLSVLPWVRRDPVLDAGTGAGLPGIPLAIARPELRFTLIDSNGKKTRFVRQAVMSLGLANVEVVQCRLEAYRPEQKFATIVARAVASLAELRDACAHLAAHDARLLALKGRLAEQELSDLTGTRPQVRADAARNGLPVPHADTGPGEHPAGIRVHPLRVPLLHGERSLIELPLQADGHG